MRALPGMAVWCSPLLLLLTAAAPSPYISMTYAAPVPQPAPTITSSRPAMPPTAYQPAPMPNRDLSAPQSLGSSSPTIAPTVFSTTPSFRSDGYTGNSTEEAAHDHRLSPSAGFNLSMPVNSW